MTIAPTEGATGGAAALQGWHRIFEPLHDEHDYVVDEIDGTIPDALTGTMYRNGPGKWEQGGTPLCHLLEGDGMISSFQFAGGRVRYRNRYVRTPAYELGLGDGGLKTRTAGTMLPGGPEANVGQPVARQANTNVQLHAGRLLALYGGSQPWELAPDTLETIGINDFGGVVGPERGFSAHHKIDPATGDLYNFTHSGGPAPTLTLYRIDPRGHGENLGTYPVPYGDWVHDFAITEHHFVFALAPFAFDYEALLGGTASPVGALHLLADRPTVFTIIPKGGGDPVMVEHEGFGFFHVTNAYEDGTDVVLDLAKFERGFDYANQAMFDYRTGGVGYFANRVIRYRVGRDRVTEHPVGDFHSDWPQLDWRRIGRKHRFSYHSTHVADTAEGGLAQVDHDRETSTLHQLGAGHITGEPSFVPRTADAAEDDGWVLFTAYDPDRHRTRLVVLDARDVGGEPVAVAHLRHHVPMTFHGSFAGAT